MKISEHWNVIPVTVDYSEFLHLDPTMFIWVQWLIHRLYRLGNVQLRFGSFVLCLYPNCRYSTVCALYERFERDKTKTVLNELYGKIGVRNA